MVSPEPGPSHYTTFDVKEEQLSYYSDHSSPINDEDGDQNKIVKHFLEPLVCSDSEEKKGEDQDLPDPGDDSDPHFQKRKRMKNDEIDCHWNLRKIIKYLNTQEQCLQFALDKGLLLNSRMCHHHRKPMRLRFSGSCWGSLTCNKRTCRSKPSISRAKNTVFDNCQLKLPYLELMYFFSSEFTINQAMKESFSQERDTATSYVTILQWYTTFREAVVIFQIKHQSKKEKVGGPGCKVRIDESKLGDTKYTDGKHRRGHWIMSLMEDGSTDFRVDIFPDEEKNLAANLVALVQKHVREGNTIRSSDWDAYSCLAEHGYTVEVIPDCNERPWEVLKNAFKSGKGHVYGLFYINFPAWFVERSWRKKVKDNCLDPFESLIECLKFVYPVKNT